MDPDPASFDVASWRAEAFLDLSHTDHSALFLPGEPVWAALARIPDYLKGLLALVEAGGGRGTVDPRAGVGARVYLAPGAVVEPNAVVKGPAWIGEGTVVRSGAYLRENVIVGRDCVLGNSSEFKQCLLFDRCEVPHFNYVGDSILGFRAHLGAGAICSNVRLDRSPVSLKLPGGERLDTGLSKFGAVVGDRCEVGCQAVLGPGAVLGRDCALYPGTQWQGYLAPEQVVKHRPAQEVAPRVISSGRERRRK